MEMAIKAAEQNWLAAKKTFWPKIDIYNRGGWSYREFPASRWQLGDSSFWAPADKGFFVNQGISISIPLLEEGSFLGIRAPTTMAAKSFYDAQKYLYLATKAERIEELAQRYLDVSRNTQEVQAAKDNLYFCEWVFKVTKDKYHKKLASKFDLKQAQLNHKKAKLQLSQASAKLEGSKARLARMLGVTLSEIEEESFPFPQIEPPPSSLRPLLESFKKRNPQLLAQKATRDQLLHEYRAERREYWPKVKAEIAWLFHNKPKADTQEQGYVGVYIDWQFGFDMIHRVREKLFDYRKANYDYRALLQDMEQELIDRFYRLKDLYFEILNAETELESKSLSLKAIKEKFALGLVTLESVYSARADLSEAEKNLMDLKSEYIMEVISLKHQAGLTWWDPWPNP